MQQTTTGAARARRAGLDRQRARTSRSSRTRRSSTRPNERAQSIQNRIADRITAFAGSMRVRLHPHPLVRLLDRVRRRELPVRPADDDRLARGDLPLDLRDDQPEPGRREASGDRRPAMADRAGRGQAKPGAARALASDPRTDQGNSRRHHPATADVEPARREASQPGERTRRNRRGDLPPVLDRDVRFGAAVYGSFLAASVVGVAYESGAGARAMTAVARRLDAGLLGRARLVGRRR